MEIESRLVVDDNLQLRGEKRLANNAIGGGHGCSECVSFPVADGSRLSAPMYLHPLVPDEKRPRVAQLLKCQVDSPISRASKSSASPNV